MDLDRIWADFSTDPGLKFLAVESPEELRERLLVAHKFLMDPERAGPLGYLYRKQVERNRELTGRK